MSRGRSSPGRTCRDGGDPRHNRGGLASWRPTPRTTPASTSRRCRRRGPGAADRRAPAPRGHDEPGGPHRRRDTPRATETRCTPSAGESGIARRHAGAAGGYDASRRGPRGVGRHPRLAGPGARCVRRAAPACGPGITALEEAACRAIPFPERAVRALAHTVTLGERRRAPTALPVARLDHVRVAAVVAGTWRGLVPSACSRARRCSTRTGSTSSRPDWPARPPRPRKSPAPSARRSRSRSCRPTLRTRPTSAGVLGLAHT